jgi:hypothetical protein
MSSNTSPSFLDLDSVLLQAPHVLSTLFALFTGDMHITAQQQQDLQTHLSDCQDCRTALLVLLATIQEGERKNGLDDAETNELFVRLIAIDHEIGSLVFERLGAYAEALFAGGKEYANHRYPEVVAHMRLCPDCRSSVAANVAYLIESQAAT